MLLGMLCSLLTLIDYTLTEPLLQSGSIIPDTKLQLLDDTKVNLLKKNAPVEDGIILSEQCIGCIPDHSGMAKYEIGCEYSAGEYINICGECVGGKTEKDEDFGVDRCGICKGLDRCSSARNGCSPDIDELDYDLQNCTLLVGIQPRVVDIASTDVATVRIITEDNDHPPQVNCIVLDKNGEKQGEFEKVQSTAQQLKFKLLKNETKLELSCNNSDGNVFTHTLMAVDTRNLKPLHIDKKEIELGQESKVTVTVANIYALSELLCFGKMKDEIVYTWWSNDIQGNSLSSQVVCDNIWPKYDGILNIGVAYSKEALDLAQIMELKVIFPTARVLFAVINKEENKIIVTFNKNVPPFKDCETIFINPASLGGGAVCQTLANEIHIEIGQGSTLKSGDLISVIVKSTPEAVQSDSVRLLPLSRNNEPSKFSEEQSDILEISGPLSICPNVSTVFSVPAKSQNTVWSLSYTATQLSQLTTSPGQAQRLNLMLWRSLREMQRTWRGNSPNNVKVNASLLIPGVDYQLHVTTVIENKMVTANKTITVIHDQGAKVTLKGPALISWNAIPSYQASLTQCSIESPQTVKYKWKMTDYNEDVIWDVDGGPLYTAVSPLPPSANYRLSLDVFSDDKLVAQDMMEITSMVEDDFQILLSFDEALFGTGHKIIIDSYVAGGFQSLESIKFKWNCLTSSGNPCVTPGKEAKLIESFKTSTSSSFQLNPGSLPVGRYDIQVKASLIDVRISTAECRLIIAAGEPPIIRLTQPPTLSSTGQTIIKISISDMIAECRIEITCLPATGTICPNDTDIRTTVPKESIQGTPYEPKFSNIELILMPLQFNANYKFRVTVDCGPVAQSFVVFTVPMIGIRQTDSLEVEPSTGVALKTNFIFKLNEMKLSVQDFTYSYGYLLMDKEIYLMTSLDPQAVLFAPPGKLKPVLNICSMKANCRIIVGPEIKVDSTDTYDMDLFNAIMNNFKEQFYSFRYKEALGIVTTVSTALNQSSSNHLFKNISEQIGNIFIVRITTISKRMHEGKHHLETAIQLLDLSTSVFEMLVISETVLSAILEFRDEIQTAVKERNDKYDKQNESSEINAEPRTKRDISWIMARTKRKIESQMDEIRSYMRTSALAMQQYSKDEKKLKSETSALLEHIPEYQRNMCQILTDTKPTEFIGTSVAEIRSIKFKNSGIKKELNITECGDKCGNSLAKLVLGKSLLEKYKDSDSICVGTSIFYDDLLSLTSNYSSEENFGRWSAVYGTVIYRYINDSVSKHEIDNSTKKPLALIRIPLWPGKIQQGREIKCHTWIDNMAWNWMGCKTAKQKMVNNQKIIECRCPVPGYFSLFAINTNDSSVNTSSSLKKPTTNNASSGPSTYSISFKINETHDGKIDNLEDFQKTIKKQLTDQLDLPEPTKLETSYDADKIKVHLKILEEDLKNISTFLESLAYALAKGNLALYDVDNKKLDIPAQQLEVTKTSNDTASEYTAVVAIGILCAAIVLSIIVGQFIRKKREQRAMRFLQGLDSPTPKYLRLTETTSKNRMEQTYTPEGQRAGRELDSGVVLTVDTNKMTSKYNHPGSSSSFQNVSLK